MLINPDYQTSIKGDGFNSELIFNNTNGNSFYIYSSNVKISDLKISGNSPGCLKIGSSTKVSNILIENVYFKNISQCVWIFTAKDIIVSKCVFDGTGYGVIQQLNNTSSNVKVSECTAFNMYQDFVEANCATAAPSENWTISNNTYNKSLYWPTPNIDTRFIGVTSVKNVIITGNTVNRTSGDAAVHLEDTLGNTIISNNIFENCISSGGSNSAYIYLLSSAEDTLISGNMFIHSDSTLPPDSLMSLASGDYNNSLTFSNNQILVNSNKNLSGINYSFQSGKFICNGNLFKNCDTGIYQQSSNYSTITNNFFDNCNNGILSNSSTNNCVVSNNQFTCTTKSIKTTRNTSGTGPSTNWLISNNISNKNIEMYDTINCTSSTNIMTNGAVCDVALIQYGGGAGSTNNGNKNF